MRMKCKNCGAELNNGKCDYCGTVFQKDAPYIAMNLEISEDELIKAIKRSLIYGSRGVYGEVYDD